MSTQRVVLIDSSKVCDVFDPFIFRVFICVPVLERTIFVQAVEYNVVISLPNCHSFFTNFCIQWINKYLLHFGNWVEIFLEKYRSAVWTIDIIIVSIVALKSATQIAINDEIFQFLTSTLGLVWFLNFLGVCFDWMITLIDMLLLDVSYFICSISLITVRYIKRTSLVWA